MVFGQFSLSWRVAKNNCLPPCRDWIQSSTPPLDHDISALDLADYLQRYLITGKVYVSRFGPSEENTYSWAITFASQLGEIPLLQANGTLLESTIGKADIRASKLVTPPPIGIFGTLSLFEMTADGSWKEKFTLLPAIKQHVCFFYSNLILISLILLIF